MKKILAAGAFAVAMAASGSSQAGYFNIFDDGTNILAYSQSTDNGSYPLVSLQGGAFQAAFHSVTISSATTLNFAASAGSPANYTWLYVHANKVVAEMHLQTVSGQFSGTYTNDFAQAGGNYSALADAPTGTVANTSVLNLVYEASANLPYYAANTYYYNNDTWAVVGFAANTDLYISAPAIDAAVANASESVPEPMSLAILGAGLAGLGAVRRRRKA